MKIFNSLYLFKKAFIATRREIFASLVILLLVTMVFTVVMWFAEKSNNSSYSFVDALIWIIAKYVEDPADVTTAPVTILGQIVGTLVGLLGVAIFAVPAGLIGSGLLDAMEDDKRKDKTAKNSIMLHKRFRRIAQSASWLRNKNGYKETLKFVPRYRSFAHIQVKTAMTNDEIIEAVKNCPDMRLIDLATTQRNEEKQHDNLAVAHFPLNNEYGCFIDRSSDVTIVAPVAVTAPGTGHFAFNLAAMGGFNFVSKELTANPDDPFGFYTMQKANLALIGDEKLKRKVEMQALHFIDDLTTLKQKSNSAGRKHWFIFIMGTTNSTEYQLHFWRLATDKNKKLARRITQNAEFGSTVLNICEETLQNIYLTTKEKLLKYNVTIKDKKQPIAVCIDNEDLLKSVTPSNIMCRIGGGIDCNTLTLRVGYEILMYHNSHLLIIKEIADAIKAQIEPDSVIPDEAIKCFMKEGDGFADEYGSNNIFEHNPEKLKKMIEEGQKELKHKYGNRYID